MLSVGIPFSLEVNYEMVFECIFLKKVVVIHFFCSNGLVF